MREFFLAVVFLTASASSKAQEPVSYLQPWEEGYMDIHHIATGQGDCTFAVLPDGTTLMIDAGDLGLPNGSLHWYHRVPDASQPTGEWICRYIRRFSPNPDRIDYAMITHFHSDHIGSLSESLPGTRGYRRSGITYVGDTIRMGTLVDRGWPGYDFPSRQKIVKESSLFGDYLKFVQYWKERGMEVEGFRTGANDQFVLKNKPRRYRKTFEIRNLVGNARVWTGVGTETRAMYSGDPMLFDENQPSCGIRIRYGGFTYYNCGDLSGMNFPRYKCRERDFESYVADVCGRITVMKCDHHAATDAVNEKLIRAARPKAFIVLAGHREHPWKPTMERMVDKSIYPDDREYYITTECSKKDLGPELWSQFKPAGHVVVRVYPGGKRYRIFVLDVFSGDCRVKFDSGPRKPF